MRRKWSILLVLLIMVLGLSQLGLHTLSPSTPQQTPNRIIIPPATLPQTTFRANTDTLRPVMADTMLINDPDVMLNLHAPLASHPAPRQNNFEWRCATDVMICADIPAHMWDGTPRPTLVLPDATPPYVVGLPPLPAIYNGDLSGPLQSLGVLPREERNRLQRVAPLPYQ